MSYYTSPPRTRSPVFGGAAEDYYYSNPIAHHQLGKDYPRRRSTSTSDGRYYDDRASRYRTNEQPTPRSYYNPRPRTPPPPAPPSSHYSDRDRPRRRPRSYAPPKQRSDQSSQSRGYSQDHDHDSCGGTCKEIEKQYGGFGWGQGIELALVGALTIFSFDKAYSKHKQRSEEREERRKKEEEERGERGEREKGEKKRSQSRRRERSRQRSRSRTWGPGDDFDEDNFADDPQGRSRKRLSVSDDEGDSLADSDDNTTRRRNYLNVPDGKNRRRDGSRRRQMSRSSPRRGETW